MDALTVKLKTRMMLMLKMEQMMQNKTMNSMGMKSLMTQTSPSLPTLLKVQWPVEILPLKMLMLLPAKFKKQELIHLKLKPLQMVCRMLLMLQRRSKLSLRSNTKRSSKTPSKTQLLINPCNRHWKRSNKSRKL